MSEGKYGGTVVFPPAARPRPDMSIIELVLIFLVVVAVLLACRPRPVFVIRIRDGTARAARGPVPQAFVGQVQDICREHHIAAATMRGFLVRKRIVLAFSRHIPPPCQQKLRNIWNLYF